MTAMSPGDTLLQMAREHCAAAVSFRSRVPMSERNVTSAPESKRAERRAYADNVRAQHFQAKARAQALLDGARALGAAIPPAIMAEVEDAQRPAYTVDEVDNLGLPKEGDRVQEAFLASGAERAFRTGSADDDAETWTAADEEEKARWNTPGPDVEEEDDASGLG